MLVAGNAGGPQGSTGRPLGARALGWLLVAAVLVLAIAAPVLFGNRTAKPAPAVAPPPPTAVAPMVGELPLLQVAIADADWQVLAAARERAMQQGILEPNPLAVVPASVTRGSDSAVGTVRLKGDWLDHVDTDQWSLRFELDTPLGGMRRFSVQHPKTRGFVMEWLVMETARREGLLAPRCDFVRVAINGAPKGIYYLEEHFSKELLEANGRREGPIVRFDESAMWATWLQHGFHRTGRLVDSAVPATNLFAAVAAGFGEGQLQQTDALNRRLQRALAQARDLQRMFMTDLHYLPQLRLQALAELEGRTIDDLFVADQLGRFLGVYTLYRCFHGLAWHQLRFYHDPVLDRLEPILFDSGAGLAHGDDLVLAAPEATWFTTSDAVMAAAHELLGRMTQPDWLPALLRDLQPKLEQAIAAMKGDGMIPAASPIDDLLPTILPQQLAFLRNVVHPVVAANFIATVVGVRTPDGNDRRAVEVEAWATTKVPVRITGFRFSNGRIESAAKALIGRVGQKDDGGVRELADNAVLLPGDLCHVVFRFPIDRRLASLGEAKAFKQAIRARIAPDRDNRVAVDVLFRTLAETTDRTEALVLRRLPDAALDLQARPPTPTLEQALNRYPFLVYDFDGDRLLVPPGRHELDDDLVLPDARPLHLQAGAQLWLPPGKVIVAAAILAEGTEQAPVVLGPRDPAQGWCGLQVLGGAGPSRLAHVQVSGTTAVDRGGWQSLGGLTFYRAPVEFHDCTFRGARCEDAINLFGVRFRMVRCEFDGGLADLFDGDFVTGEIADTKFTGSGGDAIDLSGSQVVVRGCTFARIGDKCVSAGERSSVQVERCEVGSTSIAIAAKDRSEVTVAGLTVAAVEQFVFAAYVKKAEYGAASLRVDGFRWTGAGAPPQLAQTGCTIVVDGQTVPTQEIDVEELYRRRVLGK